MAVRSDSEDRVLHVWTPRILRGTLGAAVVLLLAGLCVTGAKDQESYLARYRALRGGDSSVHAMRVGHLLHQLVHGQGRALLVAGLLVLTLVPIGRVAFTVVVFVLEHDWIFAALTSLVLALLFLGVLLGRMG
jgi:uncharacterized membrane protein